MVCDACVDEAYIRLRVDARRLAEQQQAMPHDQVIAAPYLKQIERWPSFIFSRLAAVTAAHELRSGR